MFHITLKSSLYKFAILIVILIIALSVNYLYAAWVGPTQAPPNGNTPTPVNVGDMHQVKDAGLGLNALAVFGNSYMQETLGIRTAAVSVGGEQDLTVDIEGAVGAQFYCDENGNNCFRAADGGNAGSGARTWSVMNRQINTAYQNASGREIDVAITLVAPGESDHTCLMALEVSVGGENYIPIGSVDGRASGRWKDVWWGISGTIPADYFYRIRSVDFHAQKECSNEWIHTWAELR